MKKLHRKILIALVSVFLTSFYQTIAQQLNLSLTPSNYNGYHISCFGNSDGSINLTITGGIPPYQILWSTADTIEYLENLPAGYYNVRVTDSDSVPQMTQAEITLTEPRQIKIGGTIHSYPNGYQISVNGACNGIVDLTAEYGVSPYQWLWNDNNTSPNRTSLCAG
ncbi:MAG: SprB repeat-containing protein [Arcticibacter sp.]